MIQLLDNVSLIYNMPKVLKTLIQFKYYIVASLILLGVLDVILTYISCRPSGLKYSFNDAGKSVFHLLILPLSIYVFFQAIPILQQLFYKEEIKYDKRLKIIISICSIVFGIFISLIMWFEVDLFNVNEKSETFLLPHDVYRLEDRKKLIGLRDSIENELPLYNDLKGTQYYTWKVDSNKIKSQKDKYMEILRNEKKWEHENFWRIPNYTLISWTETFLASICGAMILLALIIGIYLFSKTEFSDDANSIIDYCIITALLLLPEILLRLYSESYIAFFDINKVNLATPSIIFSIFFIFFIYHLFKEKEKLSAGIIAISTAVYGVVLALMGFKIGIFEDIMLTLSNRPIPVKLITLIILFLPLLVFLIFSIPKQAKAGN